MVSRHGILKYLVLLVVLALVLAACERPLSNGDDESQDESATPTATAASTTEDGSSPPEAGQETGGQETEGQGEAVPTAALAEGGGDGSAEPAATPETEQPGDQEAGGGTPDMAEATATAEAVTPPEGEPAAGDQPEALSPTAQPVPLPATHTVAPGENLYRIGLMYGMSWVTLAQYNGLPNANYIYVGQVLNIPGGSGTGGPGVPVNPIEPPPPGFVYHTVQPGENLFRIGLAYGISWIPIAEANGIVNPNQIYAGQVLKIPTNVPGPQPEFTHVVQPGQTLYSISLVYGVSLSAIAQANSIVPPYVIYPGQVLVIPGS